MRSIPFSFLFVYIYFIYLYIGFLSHRSFARDEIADLHEFENRTSNETYTPTQSSKIPAISRTFVINLDRRPKRMQWMTHRLDHLGIPFIRIPAVDWANGSSQAQMEKERARLHPLTKMNLKLVQDTLAVNHSFALNWGSVGCWQSHLQVYLQIVAGAYSTLPGPFLILEDDVEISPRIHEILSYDYLYHYLPFDWEMIFLEHLNLLCHHNEPAWRRPKDRHYNRQFCPVKFTYTTSAYVIRSPAVAAKLVSQANTDYVQVADWFFNFHFQRRSIRAYAILRKVVKQAHDRFKTDIQFSDGSTEKIPTITEKLWAQALQKN